MNSLFDYFEQFMPLSTDAKALIAITAEYVEFPKNAQILIAGNHNKQMYVIKKGIVRGYKINDKGEDITLSLWMENDTFGDITTLSLIHISEPTRRTPISYAVFC